MNVTRKDVEYIADLSRLKLNSEEITLFAEQIKNILGYFEHLNKLDTTDVEPMAHLLPLKNILREDLANNNFDREAALGGAPYREDGYYKVPSIMDEE